MTDLSERPGLHRAAQHRNFDFTFETRDDTPEAFSFEGVASVVDKAYTVRDQLGEFSETIKAGAFAKALKDSKADVALYVNHRHADVPMASSRAGTLKLSADQNLRAFATLDPLRSDVVIARSAVMRGELPQMSIGFTVNKNRDQWNADYTERVITEVNLMEVSIVRQGANPYTEAAMRSLEEIMESLTDVEMTEDEVRRAIMSLEKRLPAVPVDVINEFAERDRVERERLERKRLLRPAQV
jgi:HK97 family phage prohead protease